MNVGLCMPQPGFLQELRQIAPKNGALLIFDEVKTGAKLGWGGASEYFNVHPDMICLAKSIGGGFPLAAFGASKSVMDLDVYKRQALAWPIQPVPTPALNPPVWWCRVIPASLPLSLIHIYTQVSACPGFFQ